MISQAELKRIWHYDPLTGLFTRLALSNRSRPDIRIGDIANCHNFDGYILIGINKKLYKSHRLAHLYMTGIWPANQIDHINGVRDDNRWCNLRDVEPYINSQNQRKPQKNNTSGYVGVSWNKAKKKWHASIRLNCKTIHLGDFDDVHKAAAYYLQKKRELHLGCTI